MLLGVIADLHANLEAVQSVLDRLDTLGAEKILCLGDVAGYNANPNEVIDIIRERRIPTLMGNHDAAACGAEEPWFFNAKAKAAIIWQFERLRDDNKDWLMNLPGQISFSGSCLAVHGAPEHRDDYIIDWLDAMRQFEFLNGTDTKVCFFGHTHRVSLFGDSSGISNVKTASQAILNPRSRYLINPGSVGQPRDGDSRAAFALYETETKSIEFHRVEYDISSTAKKIIDAGLPKELALRLNKGK